MRSVEAFRPTRDRAEGLCFIFRAEEGVEGGAGGAGGMQGGSGGGAFDSFSLLSL